MFYKLKETEEVSKGKKHLPNELSLTMSGTPYEVSGVHLPWCAECFPGSAEAMGEDNFCLFVLELSQRAAVKGTNF